MTLELVLQLDEIQEITAAPDLDTKLILSLRSAREFVLTFQTLHDQELFRCAQTAHCPS